MTKNAHTHTLTLTLMVRTIYVNPEFVYGTHCMSRKYLHNSERLPFIHCLLCGILTEITSSYHLACAFLFFHSFSLSLASVAINSKKIYAEMMKKMRCSNTRISNQGKKTNRKNEIMATKVFVCMYIYSQSVWVEMYATNSWQSVKIYFATYILTAQLLGPHGKGFYGFQFNELHTEKWISQSNIGHTFIIP